MQSQKAVTAYFPSEQLTPFGYAGLECPSWVQRFMTRSLPMFSAPDEALSPSVTLH